VLVTGGANGIGAAVVERLGAAGARVSVVDLADATGVADLVLRADVTSEDAVVAAVDETVRTFGGLDAAVLAAGIGGMAPVMKMTLAEWDRVMDVNLRGAFVCLRECARAIAAGDGGGSIVAVSSVSAASAERGMAHYSASKAGLDALVRVASRELGPKGIRINALAPGTTDTPLFTATDAIPGYRERVAARSSLGRVGSADEVAEAVVGLLQMTWVTGQVLVADGGLSRWSPLDPLER
jgi:NAD(P)-dependent dehydrogenase (short-subunit alcohol dehydrogenase family)